MRQPIPEKNRRFVAQRANHRCEYCHVHQDDSFLGFEIDHIISLKHGGGNEIENLALACPHCNQHKGSDLTTILESYEDIIALFNPRKEEWTEHFDIQNGEILPKTRIGKATIKLLKLNQPDLLISRQILSQSGRYP